MNKLDTKENLIGKNPSRVSKYYFKNWLNPLRDLSDPHASLAGSVSRVDFPFGH